MGALGSVRPAAGAVRGAVRPPVVPAVHGAAVVVRSAQPLTAGDGFLRADGGSRFLPLQGNDETFIFSFIIVKIFMLPVFFILFVLEKSNSCMFYDLT